MDTFRQMLKGRTKGVYVSVYEMDKFRQTLRGEQRVFICMPMRWTSPGRYLQGNKGCLYVYL